MKEELINKAYEIAKERYAAVGVDTDVCSSDLWSNFRKCLSPCIVGRPMMFRDSNLPAH